MAHNGKIEEIKAYWLENKNATVAELSERFGLCASTISYHVVKWKKEAGVPLGHQTAADLSEVAEKWIAAGCPPAVVFAKVLGIKESTLKVYLTKIRRNPEYTDRLAAIEAGKAEASRKKKAERQKKYYRDRQHKTKELTEALQSTLQLTLRRAIRRTS